MSSIFFVFILIQKWTKHRFYRRFLISDQKHSLYNTLSKKFFKQRQSTLVWQFVSNFLPAAHHSIAAKTLVFAMFSVLSFTFQASHKIQEPAPTAKFRSNFNFVSRRPQRVAKLEKLKLPCAICNDRAKAVPRAPLPQAKVDIAKCSIIGRIYDSNDILGVVNSYAHMPFWGLKFFLFSARCFAWQAQHFCLSTTWLKYVMCLTLVAGWPKNCNGKGYLDFMTKMAQVLRLKFKYQQRECQKKKWVVWCGNYI